MTIRRLQPGARLSGAVVHGNTVYLAGQVAANPINTSVSEQTREILQQIDGLLATAGSDKSKLLQASVFIADLATFAEMNVVWEAWVSPGNTPCRTTIEAKLASPHYAIEIAVIAAV